MTVEQDPSLSLSLSLSLYLCSCLSGFTLTKFMNVFSYIHLFQILFTYSKPKSVLYFLLVWYCNFCIHLTELFRVKCHTNTSPYYWLLRSFQNQLSLCFSPVSFHHQVLRGVNQICSAWPLLLILCCHLRGVHNLFKHSFFCCA